MIKRQQSLYKRIAKKIDNKVMKNHHRWVVIVSLNWFERYLLNRDWDRNKAKLKNDINYHLMHAVVVTVEAHKVMHGRGLSLVEFTARRHIEM